MHLIDIQSHRSDRNLSDELKDAALKGRVLDCNFVIQYTGRSGIE